MRITCSELLGSSWLAFAAIEACVSQVLRKGSKGPQIDDGETFTVDWKFKDK